MKAFKGCINKECKAYQDRMHLKSDYEYCPYCAQKISYVCAECWDVLPQNNNRICVTCLEKRQDKKQQHMDQGKALAKEAADVAIKVAPVALKHKDKIIDGGKKVVEFAAKVKK